MHNGWLVSVARNLTYSGKYKMAVSQEPVIGLKYRCSCYRKGIETQQSNYTAKCGIKIEFLHLFQFIAQTAFL